MAEDAGLLRKDLIIANGIDAVSGEYALPPLTPADMKQGIITGGVKEPESKALKSWLQKRREKKFTLQEGLDPRRLDEAGWGIVFPVNTDPAVIEALRPLMEHRKAQAGELYREYADNPKGAVRPVGVDNKGAWLGRQGAENYGPVDPVKVPYYLLLVGSPEEIDYRFQYQLDVQYAVGRIHFDTPEGYARYAERVVQAESQSVKRKRRLTFFGPANPGDAATDMSAQYLIQPLVDYTASLSIPNQAAWDVQKVLREPATKARLGSLLAGNENPGLLFTASHGMAFHMDDARQQPQQGALLCQDWPGPGWRGGIPEDFYYSAEDLPSDANLAGLIAFFFACYGGGTPQYDEFYRTAFKDRGPIAERSFVARLPQKMLEQGALAVIGHVERAWGYSFIAGDGLSLGAFRSALRALMSGAPVGYAFEYFNERYAELTTDLTDKIQSEDWDPVDPIAMASAWTATNDAKNYMVLGDPAARVLVGADLRDEAAIVLPEAQLEVAAALEQPVQQEVVEDIPHDEAIAAAADEAAEDVAGG